MIQSVIVLEKGDTIDSGKLQKYLSPPEIETNQLPVPTNITVDQAERELIYRILLELKSDMNQIKQFIFSQFMQPKSLQEWRPINSVNSIQSFEEIKPVEENKTLEEVERDLILRTLERNNWSKRKSAQILGISERTLYRKINEYNLQDK